MKFISPPAPWPLPRAPRALPARARQGSEILTLGEGFNTHGSQVIRLWSMVFLHSEAHSANKVPIADTVRTVTRYGSRSDPAPPLTRAQKNPPAIHTHTHKSAPAPTGTARDEPNADT